MIVYKIQINQLYEDQHFPLDFKLAQFNHIVVDDEQVTKGDVIECFLFMAELPKKEYKKYREEYELEGYSEIAEYSINYNWTIVSSKKFKHV